MSSKWAVWTRTWTCLQVYEWIIQMRIYSGQVLDNPENRSERWQFRSYRKQKKRAVQDTVQLNNWGHVANIKVKLNVLFGFYSIFSMLDLSCLATIHIRTTGIKGQDWLLSWPSLPLLVNAVITLIWTQKPSFFTDSHSKGTTFSGKIKF